MGSAGLWMLGATALLMAFSGLPAWLVLLASSSLFAVGGILCGAFTLSIFYALPVRVLGLLEHDLLQALPLYVLVGALLNRLPLADVLFRVFCRLYGHTAAAPRLAGLSLGALLAPMNGSVGASVAMLGRALRPRLQADGRAAEQGAALICSASTIGVVVPPSLVLILLGDAMQRAHTEATNVSGLAGRIINTQDIFHAALLPAALMLLLFFAVTWWQARKTEVDAPPPPLTRRDWLTFTGVVAAILGLLCAVALGYLYAVEAAATGGLALLVYGCASRALTPALLREVLDDALAISGALFALLVGATFFTLVLRAYETDLWINGFLHGFQDPRSALAVVLLLLALSAFVLDAFEIIFVIVPVLLPPLLMLVPDAAWVAVLTLLVLQMSFLLPPFGYAVLMVGSVLRLRLSQRRLARALLPYLLVQAVVLFAVLLWPGALWHSNPAPVAAAPAEISEDEMRELFDAQRRTVAPENQSPPAAR